jgi:two-component system cell cycle sensor histidine kinase/response regulator CckA
MHPLLLQQVREHFGSMEAVPPSVRALLAEVSATYAAHENGTFEQNEVASQAGAKAMQRLVLEQARRRSVELELFHGIASLALSPAHPEVLLGDIVSMVAPVANARSAELWRQDATQWSRVLAWPTPIDPAHADDLASALRALQERTHAHEVRSVAVETQPSGSTRLLLASPADSGLTLSAELSNSLEQQASALMDHARMARASHDNAELLRAITQASASAMFAQDLEGRYVMINPAGCELLGADELKILGQTDAALVDAAQAAASAAEASAVVQLGEAITAERMFGPEPGRFVLMHKAPLRNPWGEVVGIVGVVTDLTERRALESRLLQSQKMDALGRLAGGVAHDFNNLLTVISGNMELLGDSEVLTEDDRECITSALEAAGRARDLTARLLAFGRRSIAQSSVFDANEVLRGVEPSLQRLAGPQIALRVDVDPQACQMRGDRGQLEQAIVNLAINARDAMPNGGTLTVSARLMSLDEAAARHLGLKLGPYVLIQVEDSGLGIDDAVRARIFEPFFTTKSVGRGSGLGLSMVYSFVQASHGHIAVRSAVGQGTTFDLLLPLTTDIPAQTTQRAARPHDETTAGGTILVAEDEPSVRRLASKVLIAAGYRVLEAENGVDALRVARAWDAPIDLLLSDVVMPEMGGGELWGAISQERPDLRVLFMSGYTDDDTVRIGILQERYQFLPKPFGQQGLLAAVRDALGRTAASVG